MGGGFALSIACDLRLITPDVKFGYPIARTVGNCLSMANIARLVGNFGPALANKIMLLAETIDADTALERNFVVDVVERDILDARLDALCKRLKSHAPITMRVSKEAIRRVTLANVPDGRDLVEMVYGSDDFRRGVASFLAKKRPAWTGR
jgi:enoyl-CoA hydratase